MLCQPHGSQAPLKCFERKVPESQLARLYLQNTVFPIHYLEHFTDPIPTLVELLAPAG